MDFILLVIPGDLCRVWKGVAVSTTHRKSLLEGRDHMSPQNSRFFRLSRDGGDRRGEPARACVYVFRQYSLIQDHKGLLDHPFQPDLLYNTVHGVSLLVLY